MNIIIRTADSAAGQPDEAPSTGVSIVVRNGSSCAIEGITDQATAKIDGDRAEVYISTERMVGRPRSAQRITFAEASWQIERIINAGPPVLSFVCKRIANV